MASTVEINITARDNASQKLKQLSTAFQSITGVSLGAATAVGAVSAALRAAVQFTRESITATVEYADQVRDLSRLTGMQAEETSRMIQVADDLDVSYQNLTTSLRFAVRQGIDPSIESIARMSDEYLKLQPGLERSAYLMQNFGRNGAEMAKVLEKGGAALLGMSDSMDENMVLTEAAVYQSRQFQIAMDNLSDTVEGISYRIGTRAIPALTKLAEAFTDATAGADALWEADKRLLEEGIMPQISSGQKLADQLAEMQYEETAAKVAVYETALQNVVTYTGLAYTSNESYIQSLYGLEPATLDAAEAQAELNSELDIIKSSFSELTAEMLYNKAAANLDADAALFLAQQMGLINEETYNTLTGLQALREQYDINHDGIISASEDAQGYVESVLAMGETVQTQTIPTLTELGEDFLIMGEDADMAAASIGGVKNATDSLYSKSVTVTVDFKAKGDTWIAGYNYNTGYQQVVGPVDGAGNQYQTYKAAGGPVSAGMPYIVGERGPELFVPDVSGSIVPNNQLGGGVTININGPVYGGNVERMMQDAAKRAFREMEAKYA